MSTKNFTDVVTFSRGAGKTRTNAAGLIVGVDFSSTSNTVTTGSKTFTLAADLNVNRDWPTGSSIRAVDQVGGGVMVGTVTSYTPSTQALVIEVVTVTGTGTGTNWRIGSLEMTRDLLTGAVSSEPAATNLATFSEDFTNAAWVKTGGTATANTFLAPNGSTQADTLRATAANATFLQSYTAVAGGYYSFDVYLARRTGTGAVEITADGTTFQSVTLTTAMQQFVVVVPSAAAGTRSFGIRIVTTDDEVYAWGADFINGAATSYIPTTTAQVTRAADSFALTSSALTAIRQGQGTLYVEAESADVGPTQKRAIRLSGPTGDIRLAKRGVGNFSGFTKMLEVDDALYFGVTAGNSQRDTGKEIGAITVAINERTGQPEAVNTTNSWAYDGSTEILYAGGNSEERLMKKDLSLWSGKGFGGIEVRGGTYTGSRFIFASNTLGVVFLSNDGLSWRRVNTPVLNQTTSEVVVGTVGATNRVVIVGAAGFIATSDDQGETWTAQNSGTTSNINGVVFAQGVFLFCRSNTNTNVSRSVDGITWTTLTTTAAQSQTDIAYDGTGRVVSVGVNGTIQTATITNGTVGTWSNATLTPTTTQTLTGIHFANGLWVAVGTNGVIYTSTNGTAFTAQNSGTTQQLNEVNFFNGLFIVGANAQAGLNHIYTSPDGVNWTSRVSTTPNSFIGIAASPTRVVLGGVAGSIATSEDGITYASRTNNNGAINGMAFGNGVFVSAGNAQGGSGYIATIDAAGNYTRRVSNTTGGIASVRFINGIFYALVNTINGAFVTSPDGVNWTSRLNTTGTAAGCTDIALGNGTYVISMNNGRMASSTDGLSFAAGLTGATTQNLNGIAFANNLFVSVGNAGTIITSPTGLAGSYTLRTSGTTQNLTSVMYSVRDQLWYAAGAAGTMLFSSDAINWQSVQNAGFASIDNSGLQANPMLPLFANGKNKIAISYKQNQVIASINGVSKTDLFGTIPNITAGALAENLNGLIYKTQVFPDALTEAELNAMTGL